MQLIIALLLQAVSPEAQPLIIVMGNVQAEPEEEKKICRPGAVTGTRVTKNICRSAAEWKAMQSTHFNKLDAVYNNGLSGVR